MRAAIDDDRVVWESGEGFALLGGRAYVKDLKEVGGLIGTGGWADRPVQIVGLGMDERGAEEGEGPMLGLGQEERMVQLRRLVNNPLLNRAEQVFVLTAMNEGLEI
ncbi:MAG: hypothetical protein GY910_16680 [bacterium]|nr:hypothetical protein [bacterium]